MSHQDASRNISQALVYVARQKRITQASLAKKVGLHQTGISKIVNGDRRLSLADFLAICDAVDVSPTEALQWADGPPVPREVEVGGRKYRLVG